MCGCKIKELFCASRKVVDGRRWGQLAYLHICFAGRMSVVIAVFAKDLIVLYVKNVTIMFQWHTVTRK